MLSPDELKQLINAAPPDLSRFLALALSIGSRPTELLDLEFLKGPKK